MKNLVLLLSLLFSSASFSQDMIYLNDGSVIESKVVEIGKKEIKYKKFKNLTGPDYKIFKDEVSKITYESGAEDVFSEAKNAKSGTSKKLDLGNNVVYINVVDILFQNITLAYEHFIGEQKKLGLRVPVSFSLYGNSNNNFDLWNSYNVFYSGIDLNYYPLGQRQASFFIGPSLRYGMARFRYDDVDSFGNFQSFITTGSYASVLFQSGFTWNPVKELTVTSSLGLGSRRYFTSSPSNRNTVTTASLWFAFGYRF